ncbi:MAG: hypothetical protein IKC46_12880 [Lachnospiraceae bacterium]|nr:hypothetical protein [Lachnospiraceae bacterium]
MKMEYLTDTELENIICQIEENELVKAPPDLPEHLLKALEQEKIIEFRRYRFRVLTTAAAAILVVFLMPVFENKKPAADFRDGLLVQETTRQESFQQQGFLIQSVQTDSKILETIFGGTNIFADNSRFNLFRE